MLIVHHLGISQSDRIVWLCEELELPYRLIRYERDPVTRLSPPEYRALHPFGTAPVISDGDLVLAESGAIIEYLTSKYADHRLTLGVADPGYPDYLFWFHFANGSMMPSVMVDLIVQMAGANGSQETVRALSERSNRAYALIENRLGKAQFLAGDQFTAADIMMMFPLTTMRAFVPRELKNYPNIRNYLQRVAARPAYQRAMNKADPDFKPPLS